MGYGPIAVDERYCDTMHPSAFPHVEEWFFNYSIDTELSAIKNVDTVFKRLTE
jgi:hypothetical protein